MRGRLTLVVAAVAISTVASSSAASQGMRRVPVDIVRAADAQLASPSIRLAGFEGRARPAIVLGLADTSADVLLSQLAALRILLRDSDKGGDRNSGAFRARRVSPPALPGATRRGPGERERARAVALLQLLKRTRPAPLVGFGQVPFVTTSVMLPPPPATFGVPSK